MYAKNHCHEKIYIAMSFVGQGGKWRTDGWSPFTPREKRDLEIASDNRVFYFYADCAKLSNGDSVGAINLQVVSQGFTHFQDAELRGRNKRWEKFDRLTVPGGRSSYTAHFRCAR